MVSFVEYSLLCASCGSLRFSVLAGITTPTPVQPDMVDNCDKFYFVKRGEICADIAAAHGISVDEFASWNPKVGKQCSGLWADTYACVSIVGHEGTPTTPSNG